MKLYLFYPLIGLLLLSCGKHPQESPPSAIDPLVSDQWHLDMINIKDLWKENIKGQGININVIDDGLEIYHPDLKQNISTSLSYNYTTKSNDPTEIDYHHGTMVGGVIFARDHNFIGISGIAPRATGLGQNLFAHDNSTLSNILISLTRNTDKIHISNNSWGFNDGLGHYWPISNSIIQAIEYATTFGRSKLGTILIWACGNGGNQEIDNSNYDGLVNLPQIFAICAIGPDGAKALYSEKGANLLVCAPSKKSTGEIGILTTDLQGDNGVNSSQITNDTTNTDYTSFFDGTSAAAPIVSGVSALILQKYPHLSWRDVRLILAQSAQMNDPTHLGWTKNAAGHYVNHSYGFGLVDAAAALNLAKNWRKRGDLKKFTQSKRIEQIIDENNHSITISDSNISHIEFIQIQVNIIHENWGELDITLSKEENNVVYYDTLATAHDCFMLDLKTKTKCSNATNTWIFGDMRQMGVSADGKWTITINDDIPGNVGTLNSWQLTFYGE